MFEVTVQRTGRERVLSERHYFVTKDGSHFLKGDAFQIPQKPFEDRITRLARQSSPTIGPANRPSSPTVDRPGHTFRFRGWTYPLCLFFSPHVSGRDGTL